MKKALALLMLFAALAAAATLREAAPGTAQGIAIDGILDEPAWAAAAWQDGFVDGRKGTPASQPTRFKVLAGERGLYFGVEVEDAAVVAQPRPEQGPVWHDDSVEFFVMPRETPADDPNAQEILHFIVNPDNARFAELLRGGIGASAVRPYWKSAARRRTGGYTVEALLPWHIFGAPAQEKAWRINVMRNDVTPGGQVIAYSAWNPMRVVAAADTYGRLSPVPYPQGRHAWRLASPKITRAGEGNLLELELQGPPPVAGQITAVLFRKAGGGFAGLARQELAAGQRKVRLPVALPADGDYETTVLYTDALGTRLRETVTLAATLSPITATLTHPVYRQTLYATDPDRAFRFRVQAALPPAEAAQATLLVECFGDGRSPLAKLEVPARPAQEIAVDARAWPTGEVALECTLRRPGHEPLLAYRQTLRVAAPAPGSEVRIADQGGLLVNGKPFFPRGFDGIGGDLEDVARAGCNTVHSYVLHRYSKIPQILAFLDQCQKRGIKLILIPFYGTSIGFWGIKEGQKMRPRFTEAEMRRMEEMVRAIGHHPALLGYYLYDEPRGADWLVELKRCYERLRALDPYHPVIGCDNSAPSSVALKDHCDVADPDLYPSPLLDGTMNHTIAAVVGGMETVCLGVGPGKAVIAAPQSYDVDSFALAGSPRRNRPLFYEEARAMVFGYVAVGVDGVVAYKIGDASVKYYERHVNAGVYASPELKVGYLDGIFPELKALEAFLVGRRLPPPPAPGAARAALRERADGKRLLLVVNPTPRAIQGWAPPAGLRELTGTPTAPMPPYAVLVYTDAPDLKLPATPAEIRARINAEPPPPYKLPPQVK